MKGHQWVKDRRKDPSLKLMLTPSGRLLDPPIKSPETPSRHQLPRVPIFNKQWLKRYMAGPWIEDDKSREERTKMELIEKEIFTKIFSIRKEIADNKKIPPIHVCSRPTLQNLCKVRPTTKSSMLMMPEMTRIKVENLEPMIQFFSKFSIEKQLETNLHKKKHQKPTAKTPATFTVSYKPQ